MMSYVSNSQANPGLVPGGYKAFSTTSSSSSDENQASLFPGQEGEDRLSLSSEARARSAEESYRAAGAENESPTAAKNSSDSPELTTEELAQLQELKLRDMEVRTHEQAHMAAAGQYSRGGPSFSLQKGPDGKSYAIGGEVNIDVGKENTPEATVAKMRVIKQAALAPASPSSADRRIAAQASVKEAQARQEISANQQENLLAAEKQPGNQSPSISNSSNTVVSNHAPVDSVGTLKTMLEAYKIAASY